MEVDFPENPFEDFDTFFSWYLDTIEKNMPVPMSEINASNSPASYTKRLPELSEEQEKLAYEKIRLQVNLPDDVFLMYDPSCDTIYSYWDTEKSADCDPTPH